MNAWSTGYWLVLVVINFGVISCVFKITKYHYLPLIRHFIRFGYLTLLVAGNITGIFYGLMVLYCESCTDVPILSMRFALFILLSFMTPLLIWIAASIHKYLIAKHNRTNEKTGEITLT